MGFFSNLFGGKKEEKEAPKAQETAPVEASKKEVIVHSPLNGEAVALAELNDGVFSEGMLGGGCAIKPIDNQVFAPFAGEVISVAASKHAVGIQGPENVQVLIHVGLDTVNMNGEGFEMLVEEGQHVEEGQELMIFDSKKIKEAGYPDITAVLVVDQGGLETLKILHQGEVKVGEDLIAVEE